MSLKNNLGYKYRLIRKSKQISLKNAAHDITSVSHLSDWENFNGYRVGLAVA